MIQTFYKLVDDAITDLGLNPDEVRGEQPGQWNLKKGKFDIMVDLWEQENQYIHNHTCIKYILINRYPFMAASIHIIKKKQQ